MVVGESLSSELPQVIAQEKRGSRIVLEEELFPPTLPTSPIKTRRPLRGDVFLSIYSKKELRYADNHYSYRY